MADAGTAFNAVASFASLRAARDALTAVQHLGLPGATATIVGGPPDGRSAERSRAIAGALTGVPVGLLIGALLSVTFAPRSMVWILGSVAAAAIAGAAIAATLGASTTARLTHDPLLPLADASAVVRVCSDDRDDVERAADILAAYEPTALRLFDDHGRALPAA